MYKIEFYTIKQYSGTLTFDNAESYELTLDSMRVDKSVVQLKAYRNGHLEATIHNPHAVPRTKSSPVEKGHIR